jgi:aspartate racemase
MDNRTDYPREQTVHGLFEEQAAATPNAVALRFEDQTITYRELNERANRLARHLRTLKVGRTSCVGVCLERSTDVIVGILAILKAGAAYVPLDPEYPAERLAFMIGDTAPPVILTQSCVAERFNYERGRTRWLCMDAERTAVAAESPANVAVESSPDDLAYVMYTSGSTGNPKGVLIGHRAIVRLVRNTNYCEFGPSEVFLQLAPIAFDASTFEIWGALLNGATLAIMRPAPFALDDIGAAIRRYGVTTLWLTAGLFHLMVEKRVENLRPLRQLLAGGDVLSPVHVNNALREIQDGVVINGYGPTESTTFACCYRMSKDIRIGDTVPIGAPISNTTVYVVNESYQQTAVGDSGELWIGGDGLALGYLHHPELTAEKFIPDPWGMDAGGRLYRTGDRARCRPDGNIEFLGRLDRQVKIAGHRIEPGEIESVLQTQPKVKQVAVLASSGTLLGPENRQLIAYFVGTDVTAEQLRAFLSERLPKYMVPAVFVRMDALPLTPNGKVDRGALAAPPVPETPELPREPARTDLEQTIAQTWSRVLGRTANPTDNFFDLGGDSLLLIEVHAELQKQLGRDIELMDLFEATTVRQLANRLSGSGESSAAFTEIQERAQERKRAFARQKTSRVTS